MTKVHCSIKEQYANPLFEVFDGGDFVLSSYHDIESDYTEMRVYFEDASAAPDAVRRLTDALVVVGCKAKVEIDEVPDEDWACSGSWPRIRNRQTRDHQGVPGIHRRNNR